MADMISAKTACYIDSIEEAGQYGQKFVTRNYKDDPSEVKYPCFIGMEVSSKKLEQLMGIGVGDKVEIEFVITGRKGVAKTTGKPYQMNKLMATKITLVEKSEVVETVSADDDDSLPF